MIRLMLSSKKNGKIMIYFNSVNNFAMEFEMIK